MNDDRPIVRVYRALIHLYPSTFRDDYGDDMVQLLREQCDDEGSWRVGARAALDMAITLPTQHLEARMNRPPTHLVPVLYAAIAVGGVLTAILAGSNLAIAALGLCIAVAAGAMAAISWRRSEPVGDGTSNGVWWKLVLAGPCIIAAVIVAAELGVDAWEVGMLAVFAGIAVSTTGALLGIVRRAQRHSRAVPT